MKTQKNNALKFNKSSILELKQDELVNVNGGGTSKACELVDIINNGIRTIGH